MRFASLRVLGFAAALAVPQYLFAEDQIFPNKGGQPARGTITEMTNLEVTLQVEGSKRAIPANEIARISYDEEPGELSGVRVAVANNNFKSALEDLKKLDPASLSRPELKGEVDYLIAYCLTKLATTEGGDKATAEAALKAFTSANRKHYRFFAAAELLGDLALSGGNFADAEKYYNAVAKVPWPDVKARATVALGKAGIGQAKYAEAEKAFNAVISDPTKTADMEVQRRAAKVGLAVCLANGGKADEAITMLTDGKTGVIAETDSKDGAVMAQAYNALGTAYLKAGKKKDALLAFLHTDTLYFREPDAHAEALYNLASLWSEMQKSDRAAECKTTLRQRYAGSVWASK